MLNTISLQRHNEHDGVSNHQPHECLLNRLVKAQIKENIKAPRHWPLGGEFTDGQWIPRTKGQEREKKFLFDDVIMIWKEGNIVNLWQIGAEIEKIQILAYRNFSLQRHVLELKLFVLASVRHYWEHQNNWCGIVNDFLAKIGCHLVFLTLWCCVNYF